MTLLIQSYFPKYPNQPQPNGFESPGRIVCAVKPP